MGGFGSGKGFRFSKRQRKRPYVDEYPFITCRSIDPKIVGRNCKSVEFSCLNHKFIFKVQPHQLPGNGIWYSFFCPCGRGARKLYFSKLLQIFRCRACWGMAYRLENRGKTDRAIDMKWKIIHQLTDGIDCSPPKPRGMHQRTYEKLIAKIDHYEKRSWNKFLGS